MKIDPLPPIPSPPEHHWRQFRVNVLPVVAFVGVLVITVWLWGANLANPLVIGQAEGLRADVVSPVAGRVAQLHAQLYEPVRAGDVVAVINASDPTILSNTVALIRAQMDAVRAEGGMDAGDRVRFAQFQMDWLTLRADLATVRADLQYSEAEFERIQRLQQDGIANQSELDVARRDVERLQKEEQDKAAAVALAERALQTLDPARTMDGSASVKAALAVAAEQLRLAEAELQPVTLRAPISGRVTAVDVPDQGTVVRGGVILKIASPQVDRIVGYVAQPVRVEPKVGMKIEVRSRGAQRRVIRSEVIHVGPRIELFDAPLRIRGMGTAQQRGLPFVVSAPRDLNLLPGELVDLRLLPE